MTLLWIAYAVLVVYLISPVALWLDMDGDDDN